MIKRYMILFCCALGISVTLGVDRDHTRAVSAASALPDISKLNVPSSRASSFSALVKESDLIAWVSIGEDLFSRPTGRTLAARKIIHYTQKLSIKQVWKGRSNASSIQLLTSGLEPLPHAKDPLNQSYTGPLADGEYVCFLRSVPASAGLYTLTGLWQGIYPIFDGTSIAMEGSGFTELDGLPLRHFEAKVKQALSGRQVHP